MTHSLLLLLKLRLLLLHLTWGILQQPRRFFEVLNHCRKQQHKLLLNQVGLERLAAVCCPRHCNIRKERLHSQGHVVNL